MPPTVAWPVVNDSSDATTKGVMEVLITYKKESMEKMLRWKPVCEVGPAFLLSLFTMIVSASLVIKVTTELARPRNTISRRKAFRSTKSPASPSNLSFNFSFLAPDQ